MLIQNTSNLTPVAQPEVKANVRIAGSGTVGDIVHKAIKLEPQRAPTAESAQPAKAQQATSEQLNRAVGHINRALQQSNQNLLFSLDPDTDKLVVKLVDTTTGELIRQIPSDAVLAIAHSIDQFQQTHQIQQGMLLKQKA